MKIRTRLTLWYTAVLFAILVVISALSYSLLSWSLTKDIDASLLTVGQIVRDVGWEPADASIGSAEAMVREILGPEFYDKFFRLIDPDGQPRAYISNLTVDPDYRGLGYGRALLAAGLEHLQRRGAGSITLGVDGGNATPLQLYRSAGFEVTSSIDAWDKRL